MTEADLAAKLVALGCPAAKAADMAAMLDRRAHQLAQAKDRSYDDALAHLLGLMQQGWAAQEKASCAPRTTNPAPDAPSRPTPDDG